MFKQKVLNKVWDHFIVNNGVPGYNAAEGICTYGEPGEGPRCAVGIFDHNGLLCGKKCASDDLEDDVVHQIFDPMGSPGELENESAFQDAVLFLRNLQFAHDTAASEATGEAREAFKALFIDELRVLAASFNLQLPSL